jgi:DNA-directed RNA polymerase specialized sigma24 family protein
MLVPGPNSSAQPSGTAPALHPAAPTIPAGEAFKLAHAIALRFFGARKREIARDVAQDALLKLYSHSERIRVGWKAILPRIVLNTARSFLKAEQTYRAHVAAQPVAADTTSAGTPAPAERMITEEELAALAARLPLLDEQFEPGTRAIVEMRMQGLSWEEITDIMRLADRTCRYRYEKAVDWLSRNLSLQTTKGGNP